MLDDEAFSRLRRAIDELAEADAPELVVEARVVARAKVRSILADELAEAMLERSRTEMRALDGNPACPRTGIELGWYVYGVVASPGPELPDDLPGVDPRLSPLIVVEDDLAAIASQIPLAEYGDDALRARLEDPEWLAARARAHDAVLEVAMLMSTVVPMRLCTTYANESGLRRMLVREHDSLAAGLARFDGKAEWRVAVRADRPGPDRDECAAAVHERLAGLAAETLVVADGELAFDGAYLVEDDAVGELYETAAAVAEEFEPAGCRIAPSGPFPPYNFVKGTIEAPW